MCLTSANQNFSEHNSLSLNYFLCSKAPKDTNNYVDNENVDIVTC